MSTTTVKLSRRYEVPGATPFDTITIREPTFNDMFMAGLGKPREWQPNGNGGGMLVTYTEVVDKYAQRLIVSPGYEFLGHVSAVDAVAIEEAICDFFTPMKSETSPTP